MKANPLFGASLYLSGAIENAPPDTNWRTEPIKILTEKFGINVFDPSADPKQQWVTDLNKYRQEKNYEKIAEIAKKFVSKDLRKLELADFLIAYLPRGVCTTGTHHEIIFSNDNKKITLLICPEGKEFLPIWYFGFVPTETMFGSWNDLYVYLEEVNKGLHVNNRRWHYVYGII